MARMNTQARTRFGGAIADFLNKARQRPMEVKKLVTQLRKSPYGLKCRVMPIFFAAVAHLELALGKYLL